MALATLDSRHGVSDPAVTTNLHVKPMLLRNRLLERISDRHSQASTRQTATTHTTHANNLFHNRTCINLKPPHALNHQLDHQSHSPQKTQTNNPRRNRTQQTSTWHFNKPQKPRQRKTTTKIHSDTKNNTAQHSVVGNSRKQPNQTHNDYKTINITFSSSQPATAPHRRASQQQAHQPSQTPQSYSQPFHSYP